MINVTVYDGKYTVIQDDTGGTKALRYGEPWRDCTGDGLILALAQRIDELETKVKKAENCLVCVAIADPVEVCQNTLAILKDGS